MQSIIPRRQGMRLSRANLIPIAQHRYVSTKAQEIKGGIEDLLYQTVKEPGSQEMRIQIPLGFSRLGVRTKGRSKDFEPTRKNHKEPS